MMRTLKEFTRTIMVMKRLCDETFGITKYCLDLEIEILDILSIYCSCWSNFENPIIHKIFGPEAPISFSNAIKDFIIPSQYNKDNAYWANLFTRVKSWIKEIRMDMIYLPIFKLWGYIYFQNTNSLLLFGDIDLKLMKNQTLFIKVLKLMIHICSPESCKIIYQVSIQTLVCVCISITSCKNKIVH